METFILDQRLVVDCRLCGRRGIGSGRETPASPDEIKEDNRDDDAGQDNIRTLEPRRRLRRCLLVGLIFRRAHDFRRVL